MAGQHAGRVASLVAVSVPHLGAFAEALEADPDQRDRSAYFTLFRQEGKAEDVLLADDARRLRAMFADQVPEELVRRHLEFVGDRAGLTGALNWYRAMRRYDLPAVSVRTTVLRGENDTQIARRRTAATDAPGPPYYRL